MILVPKTRRGGKLYKKIKMEEREDCAKEIKSFMFSDGLTLEDIRKQQVKFAEERDWDQFHSPRNLLLAMIGEVGELAEVFQWKGEVKEGLPGWTEKDLLNVRHELSDVLILLVRLADKCKVDLAKAVVEKVKLNEQKYPADKVRGSSKKYTEYEQDK
ncbi:dCTP pyrophosphatase 1-like [Rhopilema esculentum]|uniref:dCTP pyrophosphatase 1-like n=1 Tax=Rhopilema esculentum TaxID=499914 RepID=UPI0031D3137A